MPVESRFIEQLALKDTDNKILSVKELNIGYTVVNHKSFVTANIHQNGRQA